MKILCPWVSVYGAFLSIIICLSTVAHSLSEGALIGVVSDDEGVVVANATVIVKTLSGRTMAHSQTSATGEFRIFPLDLGHYTVTITLDGFQPMVLQVTVSSGAQSDVKIQLVKNGKEMVREITVKKQRVQQSSSTSRVEIDKEQIQTLPQGSEISLPKLLTSTTPGVVPGTFGQMFFRGNHADIQYQLDGVQLPDSPSNTFGQAFSPRNIDTMEVITGGIPAEYGQRLAAVVNIITKSGPENPGGDVELNYGSYNTFSPHLLYGGSNDSGAVHYFVSANYMQTSRGLDTQQPSSETDQRTGGSDAVHDKATGNSEFAKIDWLKDNSNKFSFILFNSESSYQIPNYPSSFQPGDQFFKSSFGDPFGNVGENIYTPPNTNDRQDSADAYIEAIWKHTVSSQTFYQLAPYYKYSYIRFQNDPANDLISGNPNAASFYENRTVGNYGVKGDLTTRMSDKHLVKTGFQLQFSQSTGPFSVQTSLNSAPVGTNDADTGYLESVYVQDDYTLNKRIVLNVGARIDATQFSFSDASAQEALLEPRIGVNYMLADQTKVHAFYGKLFQPAPVEDLRALYVNSGNGQEAPYNIRAEKDDYYEVGIAQQVRDHLVSLNAYYKNAIDMLDDQQLFNTAIAQPFNFAKGYAYGVELSVKGDITSHWSDYLNYSYEIAKGEGIGGGLFAFPSSTPTTSSYQFLDHVQIHTANAGVSYTREHWWWTTQALYGSGLRTGPNNSNSLPSHLTFDTTVGYKFPVHGIKTSFDILNVTDLRYPITVANGFNGSHYAAGREYFVRVSTEF